ncbi:MAG: hypothetical protein UR99_C0031G0003 [Candidatus Moranbacteria bacterium GW2011_GWD2_36_12]|nr:MAG: hypothetical protein UR99_C0031G0003 [Candidatus Moranbacteria bacterium GW2011_GWD2_36_12]KKQ06719.1 MAG: hypothetical protein US16_C0010G0003 [Candidatus Moranbacteria bacterium GW2011_GWE2_36_40]
MLLGRDFNTPFSKHMDNKPTKGAYLEAILRSTQTVFSSRDAALLWSENNVAIINDRLKKYVKAGKLIRVHQGFYAKDVKYNRFELAVKIYTPSYVSFETVLTREGVNFQYYGNIFVASYLNREIKADDQKIDYVRMKDYVLSNIAGVEHRNGVAWATKERAFLDRIYVSKDYHFDNLDALNWDKVFEILPIYKNKRLEKKVQEYYKYFISNQ